MTPASELITGRRRLTRNALWNFVGQGAPLVVALVAIPPLVAGLGTDRFGVLTLIWALVGYSSLFDFGLGRALTQLVAVKLGAGQDHEVPALSRTALTLTLLLGVLGALLVMLAAPLLTRYVFRVTGALETETLTSLRLVACALPFVLLNIAQRGLLEAYGRFDLVNIVRIPLGVSNFLAPLLVLPLSTALPPAVAALLLGRVASVLVYAHFTRRVVPGLGSRFALERRYLRPLFGFGGWMTVSNVVAPMMLYLDRFFIAAALSVAAVAYYATPFELVTRLWIVPTAVLGVLFPAMGLELARDPARARRLYVTGRRAVLLLLAPAVLGIVLLASWGLNFWLGPDFARESSRVTQILAVGVLLQSLSQCAAALIQAAGRPDLTARVHLAEVVPYLAYLWWLMNAYGLVGVALAWLLRVAISFVVLSVLAGRTLARHTPRTQTTPLETPLETP